MSGNMQTIWKWLGHVSQQFGHVYIFKGPRLDWAFNVAMTWGEKTPQKA